MAEHSSSKRDVMISYNWGAKKRMLKLRDKLEAVGISAWIDDEDIAEQPGEGLADRLAKAVEDTDVFLMCYSKKYQESRNCKAEAIYAKGIGKRIIPLKYENYNPDGWLGILLGDRLYYDVTSDQRLEDNFDNLVKEIKTEMTDVKKGPKNTEVTDKLQDMKLTQGSIQEGMANFQDVLIGAMEILPNNLAVNDVLITLVAKHAITMTNKHEITAQVQGGPQIVKLLELLMEKSEDSYNVFMEVLRTKRIDLYKKLKALETGGATADGGGQENTKTQPKGTLEQAVTEKDCSKIADVIQSMHRRAEFFNELGIIERDREAKESKAGNDPYNQARAVLLFWKQCNGREATRQAVITGLDEVGKNGQIIEDLKKLWNVD
ncbi:uncharacterized protein [Amphiura filiformis]|uniref:uncharacterized protein n=1 Tax=Amphiura filiformis TaxID=82378 RepID=UPI003B220650